MTTTLEPTLPALAPAATTATAMPAPAAAAELRPTLVLASKSRRFSTLIVDYLGFMVLSFVVGITIGLLFGPAGAEALQKVPNLLLGSALFFVYYLFFEAIWARTPGKFLLGTVVVREDGNPPTLDQVIKRTLCRFIPFEAFSFFGDRGWHDSIPDVRVVLVKPV